MSVKNQSITGPTSTKNEKMEMAVFAVSFYVWVLLSTCLKICFLPELLHGTAWYCVFEEVILTAVLTLLG